MKYIKTYEALSEKEKEEFIKSSTEPFISFNINKLIKDCKKYNIVLIDLLREILVGKKIAFYCNWCYTSYSVTFSHFISYKHGHNIIGNCEEIKYEDLSDEESDIDVKIKDEWHTLFNFDVGTRKIKKVRVYNYEEGPIMQELEAKKSAEKYNL